MFLCLIESLALLLCLRLIDRLVLILCMLLLAGFNKWRAVAYFWRLRVAQADELMRRKISEAYPVESYLPSAIPALTAPMQEFPEAPTSNIQGLYER